MPAAVTGGALRGLKVLDTASLYAGPFIATLLADHGADVVKIEPPGGDDYRHHPGRMWPLLARNKRSVSLDLTDEDGRARLLELVGEADVIVLNMPLATLQKRGLDHATLFENNSSLIIAQVTSFGLDGPDAAQPGNGTLAEARAGLTNMTGDPEGSPVLASVPLGDAVTGFAGAFGVLAACYRRLATGEGGVVVDINPLEAMLHVVGPMLTAHRDGGPSPTRLGSRLLGSDVRNVFPTSDGRWLAISFSTPRHLADGSVLVGHDGTTDSLDASVRAWTSQHTAREAIEALVASRLPVSLVQTAAEVVADPQVVARASVRSIATVESGPVWSPGPAPRIVGVETDWSARTPDVDEHRSEVLQEWSREQDGVTINSSTPGKEPV
jgi:crotonobetainyl-CoA:carnitine CoA-transferase CaiB-like acyl-CoA transferase